MPTANPYYRPPIFIHECPTCGIIHENTDQFHEECEDHK